MYYLKDSSGNVVRALNWTSEKITFIQRHDTRRVEAIEDLATYERQGIKFSVLDVIEKQNLKQETTYPIKQLNGHLALVTDFNQMLENIDLPQDDQPFFQNVAKKTMLAGGGLVMLFFGLSFLMKSKISPKIELQVVQVMDRKEIERSITVPVLASQQKFKIKRPIRSYVAIKKTKPAATSSGVLAVLGSLNKSKQQGGLKLDQAQTSAGIGRGGKTGSGGVQTTVYSKGMFSSPLGKGGKVLGAGGYGTRGKGGGKAGYGQVSLVGSGKGFFQPVESEAWVGGGLDRNEIAAVINRHLSEVRFCYEQGLQQKPKLAGRLSMNFMIGPNGLVAMARVMNSSLGHDLVENCIRDRLKTWNFPKPEGGVTVKVTYPFILRRVSDT